MARGRGRELAFQALFQAEQGQSPLKEVWKDLRMEASQGHPWQDDDSSDTDNNPQAVNTEAFDMETLDFSEKLLNHFDDNREHIDSTLENELEGWTFKQMAQTDLSILRLTLAEIFYEGTPEEVSINMAVRIAKKYGGEESGKFVNGVLGRFFRKLAAEKNNADQNNASKTDSEQVGEDAPKVIKVVKDEAEDTSTVEDIISEIKAEGVEVQGTQES